MNFSNFSYFSKLADSGVLGVLLTMAIFAIIYLFRKLNDTQQKEIDDKDKMILVLKSSNETLEQILQREKYFAHVVKLSNNETEEKK